MTSEVIIVHVQAIVLGNERVDLQGILRVINAWIERVPSHRSMPRRDSTSFSFSLIQFVVAGSDVTLDIDVDNARALNPGGGLVNQIVWVRVMTGVGDSWPTGRCVSLEKSDRTSRLS